MAIADVFGTAMGGRRKDRPEPADASILLEATLEVVPCRDGEGLLYRLFEPLGYAVDIVRFATLPAGAFRHNAHRFEWTRAEFNGWANTLAERYGYQVRLAPIRPDDPDVGAPSQTAVFTRGGDF